MSTIRPASAREQALTILYRVETDQAYAAPILDRAAHAAGADDRDQALLRQLVKGVLTWRGKLDHVLDQFVAKGVTSLTPWIRNVLRLGAYQILYLDRIPANVAVNESVELAKKYGHPGTVKLVNAVLRNLVRNAPTLTQAIAIPTTAEEIATAYSHPQWIVELLLRQIGAEETSAFCAADNAVWPICVRTNTLKSTTADLRQHLTAEGVSWQHASYEPNCTLLTALPAGVKLHELAVWREGLMQAQDESSAFVARAVDPQPGEFVIDLCSAPGGKTTYLAALMGNTGRILAVDIHDHKLRNVRDHCARLGITNVTTQADDARALQSAAQADRVLVDAPCSGLGVLGRRSDLRWNKTADQIDELQRLQLELLRHAATLVKPGGALVYSTCTVTTAENEATIAAFLREAPDFVLQPFGDTIPTDLIDASGFYRTWPHRHHMGGAFAAKMARR